MAKEPARKHSTRLANFLNQSAHDMAFETAKIEEQLKQPPASPDDLESIAEKFTNLAIKINALRVKNNLDIVENAIKQARETLDRAELLMAYKNVFAGENAPDTKLIDLQIVNERNTAYSALEYIREGLVDEETGQLKDDLYEREFDLYTEQLGRHAEISSEEYKAEKSDAMQDPVLQYAADCARHLNTLSKDIRLTFQSISQELKILGENTENLSAGEQNAVGRFVNTIDGEVDASLQYGLVMVEEIRRMEDFIKDVKEFQPRLFAAYTRHLTPDN